ncbi:MAG: zinc-binding dehydrogenase [Chloroflexi bacterium]|nr:zinc-binding dehydrogenase [Chloroflexota bacterium]
MRVARYYSNRDVRLEEMPVPKIGPGELLVKVISSGICGSDAMEWYRIKKAPLVLGHEIAGEIVEVGKGVRKFAVGDRVFISHHVPCNSCRYCRSGNHTVCETLRSTNFDPGGFAEYIRVPKINVEIGTFLLPDGMSFDEGAFIEPVACVVRGQRKAGMKSGQTVLVMGSGIAGILHIQLAKAKGAARVFATDIGGYRLEAARRFGADVVFRADEDVPTQLRKANGGHLADLVILCAGVPQALAQAIKCADAGGTILLFAPLKAGETFPFPIYEVWRDNITLVNTYAGAPEDIIEAIDLIHSHRINVVDMITHRFGLAETGRGFELVAGAQDSLKVIIEPQR